MAKEKENWIIEMIERESIPKTMRTETIKDFATRHNIDSSLYHYHRIKKENQEKILKLCLNIARERTPAILDKLGENAEAGKERSIEMFLKFVTGLTEKLDITVEPISIEVKTKAEKAINDYLNDNQSDITGDGQKADKGSVPIQSKE